MTKKIPVLFSVLLFAATVALAQPNEKYEFKKEKSISKTYSASGNKLSINNSFGRVNVKTVSGNEIKVNVSIEVTANKQELADKIFNNIEVTDKQSGNDVNFHTYINNSKKDNSYSCNNCKNTIQVNYEVSVPASVPLTIENQFGDIIIPDYTGPVSITSKFGKLDAGKLSNVKDLLVEFGTAAIKSASNIDATFKFSEVTINSLSGASKLQIEFSSLTRIQLDNNLTSLKLHDSYSTVNLLPASSLSASYKIHTSFGNVEDRANIGISRTNEPQKYGPDSERDFKGQTGSGQATIDIQCSFGDIILGEPAPGSLEKKKKSSGQGTRNSGTGASGKVI